MSEMIEKAAKAMAVYMETNPLSPDAWVDAKDLKSATVDGDINFIGMANEALKAMLDVPFSIIMEATGQINRSLWVGDDLVDSDVEKSFYAVINAILQAPEERT